MRPDLPDPDSTEQLLKRIQDGDIDARSVLMGRVYRRLRAIAGKKLGKGRQDASVAITELVHDAIIKLSVTGATFNDADHFFRVASSAVHSVLMDRRRRRTVDVNAKRALSKLTAISETPKDKGIDAETIAAAIDHLALVDEFSAEVMRMRLYLGANRRQICEAITCTDAEVQRALRFGKAVIQRQLFGAEANELA